VALGLEGEREEENAFGYYQRFERKEPKKVLHFLRTTGRKDCTLAEEEKYLSVRRRKKGRKGKRGVEHLGRYLAGPWGHFVLSSSVAQEEEERKREKKKPPVPKCTRKEGRGRGGSVRAFNSPHPKKKK